MRLQFDYAAVKRGRTSARSDGAPLSLDQKLLATFPEGYRHLAYLQTQIGYKIKMDMPGLIGPEVEKLYARAASWISGAPL